MVKKNGMTPRIQLFVAEYLKDRNGKQAAIRAGYSSKCAEFQASRMLSKDKVRQAVEVGLQQLRDKAGLTAERILNGILRIAEADLRRAYNEDGSLKNPKDMPDDIALALAQIETDDLFVGIGTNRKQVGYSRKVKLWDKVKAYELLGKHLNLFAEDGNAKNANALVGLIRSFNAAGTKDLSTSGVRKPGKVLNARSWDKPVEKTDRHLREHKKA